MAHPILNVLVSSIINPQAIIDTTNLYLVHMAKNATALMKMVSNTE